MQILFYYFLLKLYLVFKNFLLETNLASFFEII